MSWNLVTDTTPAEGDTVFVLVSGDKHNPLPEDEWYPDIGTFCDDMFYKLSYDPNLGVLRKVPVHGVHSWHKIDVLPG